MSDVYLILWQRLFVDTYLRRLHMIVCRYVSTNSEATSVTVVGRYIMVVHLCGKEHSIKLLIDGAFLCLIVLYAWDSGAQGGYGGT